jgi:hypothetical protein
MTASRIDIKANNNGKDDKKIRTIHNIYNGVVVSNVDEFDNGIIKVRVQGIDDKFNVPNINLPNCYPLLNKFFHIIPKIGEVVNVLLSDIDKPNTLRYWIGPIISQPQFYQYESNITAKNGIETGLTKSDVTPSQIENAKDIYPNINDIAILGRDNNDIILKDKQITLRVGKHLINDTLRLNRNNPGYINLRISDDGELSTIMTVANKIGLMSHNGKRKYKTILDSEEIDRFFEESHPMVKGDITVEVLKKIINAILFHVHGGSGLQPTKTNPIIELEKLDLNRILSENIRIN